MVFHIAKLSIDYLKHDRPKHNQSEDGVTLMLAILVLSAVTAIAFSLATIVFIEIRASGDVLRTEPALYAVQGVTEEALFKYKHYVPDGIMDVTICHPKELSICNLNSVIMAAPAPTIRLFDKAPRVDTILPSSTSTYLFIDPSHPNSFAQAYENINVTYLDNGFNGELQMTINKYDTAGDKQTVPPFPSNLRPTNSDGYTIRDIGQYELVLTNSSGEGSILASIDATDVNGNKLIPLVGKQVLDITANYLGITRKYTVSIPLP